MTVVISIPGEIRGKGRPKFSTRGGRPRAYTDAKTVSAENWVKSCAVDAMAGRALLTGPVEMSMAITVGIPASWAKKKQLAAISGGVMPTGKPDVDNTCKLVSDAFNGIVWKDDSQVVSLTVTKAYGLEPQAEIVVRTKVTQQEMTP